MKKILLLLIPIFLFYSCKTTDGALQNSFVETEGQLYTDDLPEDEEANEIASEELNAVEVSVLSEEDFIDEEKIPESELSEWQDRLNQETAQTELVVPDDNFDSENSTEQEIAVSVVNNQQETEAALESATTQAASSAENSLAQAESTSVKVVPANTNASATSAPPRPAAPKRENPPPKPARPSNQTESAPRSDKDIAKAYNFETPAPVEEIEEKKNFLAKPSRWMSLKNNQLLDIVYPGAGWIYLGEEGGGDHFSFQGRKLGDNQTTFTLRSKRSGRAVLHFYKNDALTGKYIDDAIEIIVDSENALDASHVIAPSYAEVVPPKYDRSGAQKEVAQNTLPKNEAQNANPQLPQSGSNKTNANAEKENYSSPPAPNEKVQTVIQTAETDDGGKKTSVAGVMGSAQDGAENLAQEQAPNIDMNNAQNLLQLARKAYDEKRYKDALNLIKRFFEVATRDFDAGLFLEGRILEAKSEVQNIKEAINAYDTLTKNWPQSSYWRRANERSIYLKRFYIDIR